MYSYKNHCTGERLSTRLDQQANNNQLRESLQWLDLLGVHWNLVSRIHEKLAIVDSSILWEGSLNILSHSTTKERMRRFVSETEVACVVKQHHLQCNACSVLLAELGIGQPIRQVRINRIRKKISQRELALNTNLHQSHLTKIEREQSDVHLGTLVKLAAELDMEVVFLPRHMLPSVGGLLSAATSPPEISPKRRNPAPPPEEHPTGSRPCLTPSPHG